MTLSLKSKKSMSGFSFVELVLICAMVLIISSIVAFFLYPVRQKKRARDFVRVSDVNVIARAVEEYYLDNGSFPDTQNTTRSSTALPTGSAGPLSSITAGWIVGNFTGFIQKLPTDPMNNGTYFYTYRHNGSQYEVNAVLEIDTDSASKDKGNSSSKYEMGSSLTLMN